MGQPRLDDRSRPAPEVCTGSTALSSMQNGHFGRIRAIGRFAPGFRAAWRAPPPTPPGGLLEIPRHVDDEMHRPASLVAMHRQLA